MTSKMSPLQWRSAAKSLLLGAALATGSLATVGCHDSPAEDGQASQASNAQERFIVQYHPGQGAAAKNAAHGHGGDIALDLSKHNAFAVYLPGAALAALSNNPAVKLVEIDQQRRPLAVDQFTPWGITATQSDDDFKTNLPGSEGEVTVCIIDSGFDGGHSDKWNSVTGTDTPRTKRRGAGGGTMAWDVDDCGHGTHVAGTISAADNGIGVVGIAPFAPANINLHIVRVFEGADCGWTYSSSLVAALDLCTAPGTGVDIVNMSLGGGGASSTEAAAFADALANGVLSIAAAGNEHDDSVNPGLDAYSYPASYDSVISVAAVDEGDNIASFSTRNDKVDISGPGVDVVSTVPMGMGPPETSLVGSDGLDLAPVSAMSGSNNGSATGVLVNCGDGGTTCSTGGNADFICLIERGTHTFATKANSCENGGGSGVIIYNNAANSNSGDEIVHGDYAGGATLLGAGTSRNAGLALVAAIEAAAQEDPARTISATLTLGTVPTNYSSYNGTSMATPHVAGVAALVWSHNPACSPAHVRNALYAGVRQLGDGSQPATSVGRGLVQASNSAAELLATNCDTAPPPPPPECTVDTQATDCGEGQVCVDGSCESDGSGGGGIGQCGDDINEPPGCSCESSDECYFGKCKGKPGSQTCN